MLSLWRADTMQQRLREVLGDKGSTVHHISPDKTVRQAVQAMNEHGIGSLLVMEGERIVGIFTERDVLRRVVDVGLDPDTTPVSAVMTRDCIVVSPEATVGETMSVITQQRVRHLPVVESGTLLGMVSIGDLTRWVVRHQRHEITDLVDYITGRYPG
jgi:CBS domain-containing protein